MKNLFALGAILIGAAFSHADVVVPAQKLLGVDKPRKAGSFIVVKLSPVENPPKELVKVTHDWTIFDGSENQEFLANEDSVAFGAGLTKGKILVLCSVAYTFASQKDGKTEVTTKIKAISAVVTVLGPEPVNPIDPKPNNPSVDLKSHPLYEVVRSLYGALQEQDQEKNARALVGIYRGVIADVNSGAAKTLLGIRTTLQREATKAVQAGTYTPQSLVTLQRRVSDEVKTLVPRDDQEFTPEQRSQIALLYSVAAFALEDLVNGR